MRVLHVIESLIESGGAERGLVREITSFSESVEQRVLLLYNRTDLAPQLTESGIAVDVVGLSEGRGSRSWPTALRPVRDMIRDFDPDVIQSSLFLGNLVAQMGARRSGTPVVSNLVLSGDPDLLNIYQPGAGTLRARQLRKIAGRAARGDHVYFRALTEDVKTTNAALLGFDLSRATVIPRSVELPGVGAVSSRADLGIPDGRIIVNVGRQAPQKGHLLLLEAFARVRRNVPDAHLLMIGKDAESSGQIREAIRKWGIADSITTVPHTEQVYEYLAHSDLFAFSSVMEGLGTAILEAMAAGLPIVAFDIPPVREATGDGRFADLVEVGNVDALARAIVRNLAEGERNSSVRDWVAEHHNIESVSSKVEELLRTVAKANERIG